METENKKILSIIIPTYNAAKFLDKGLSSFIIELSFKYAGHYCCE